MTTKSRGSCLDALKILNTSLKLEWCYTWFKTGFSDFQLRHQPHFVEAFKKSSNNSNFLSLHFFECIFCLSANYRHTALGNLMQQHSALMLPVTLCRKQGIRTPSATPATLTHKHTYVYANLWGRKCQHWGVEYTSTYIYVCVIVLALGSVCAYENVSVLCGDTLNCVTDWRCRPSSTWHWVSHMLLLFLYCIMRTYLICLLEQRFVWVKYAYKNECMS